MIKFLNKLLSLSFFPLLFKYITLIVYILLIGIGLMANSADSNFLNQLRNTNLGNLLIWSYWWPIIIILAVFFGRIWCMVCPVELITSFFAKFGLKKHRPSWLRSGWVITVFYILILFIGIQGFAIHRNPTFMSAYLLVIAGVSIVVGMIYKKNTFCRYVCPVGHLLGLYSRLSFLGLRVKNRSICDNCTDKSCINKEYQYNLNNKSCGVNLYPANISSNSDCILCAGCIKTCSKYQSIPNIKRPNPALVKIGFASDLKRLQTLSWAEFGFVLIISGFVIYEIWAEWSSSKQILLQIPNTITDYLHVSNKIIIGIIKSTVIFIIFPFVIWLVPFIITKISGATIKIKDYLLNYGIAFIPIIAAAHLGKAILKTSSRIPYFKHVFNDISGITIAQKIIDNEIILTKQSIVLAVAVSALIIFIMIAGIWFSIRVVKLLNRKSKITGLSLYLIPIIYGSIFLGMIIYWRFL